MSVLATSSMWCASGLSLNRNNMNPSEAPIISPGNPFILWVVIFKDDNIGWAIHSHEWLSPATTTNLDIWLANGDFSADWELGVETGTGERWISHEMVDSNCDAIS